MRGREGWALSACLRRRSSVVVRHVVLVTYPVVVSPMDGSWWSAVVAIHGGYWWAVGGHGGWACSTLVGCDVPWTPFAGANGGARSPLVGVGDGCWPPFVLPRCVFAFIVGRGWWWVLVLALALVRVAWLCAPIGGGCSDPFVSPRWVCVSATGGGWWWALAPVCAPRCVLTPVRVACHRCCVSSWLCLLVGSC